MNNKYIKNKIPLDISIDSLKIRIPFELIKVLNPSLLGKWILLNEDTGEVDPKVFKQNALSFSENGIKTKFGIEKQYTKTQKTRDFLVILVNSKLLKHNYFEGINSNTIEQLYNNLMSFNVISISYKDFISVSEGTDIDIKKDCNIPMSTFTKSIDQCRQISKPSKLKDSGYRVFRDKDNKGIEWSTRKSSSYKSKPFLKIYHKETELKNNSIEFSEEHLEGIDYTDIVRIETTIKNAAHFRHLGVNTNSLKDILKLSQDTLQGIMSKAIKQHLEPRVRQIKKDNKLKPFELIIYASILLSMKGGVSYESYKSSVLSVLHNKTERNRKRKVLDMIYDRHIKGLSEDKTSQEKDVFWRFLNWS